MASLQLQVRRIMSSGRIFQRGANLVRVRFAPSPTGQLHLGGLRTALYNYMFARRNNGRYVLRIEDTDKSRYVEGATQQIVDDLHWVGMTIDEGPTVGGPFAPYVQSERLETYRNAANNLLEKGAAYMCFCTERRLEVLRREAIRSRQIPKYDNRCRDLTRQQITEKLNDTKQFCIRFKMRNSNMSFNDLVGGETPYNISESDGDPVIMKSDGFPTYHFANVVDDHMMQITHVFRGIEWKVSTPKHLQIYSAFGWEPPHYGHLPLLVNKNGTKLSKRQGDVDIRKIKEQGILPEALVNFVVQAGGGLSKEPQAKMQSRSLQELTQNFDIAKVSCHPSRVNPELLYEYNRLEIMRKVSNPIECAKLAEQIQTSLVQVYGKTASNLNSDIEYISMVLKTMCYRITSLSDLITGKLSFLFTNGNENYDVDDKISTERLLECLAEVSFTTNELQSCLQRFSITNDVEYVVLMQTLRRILCGSKDGPGVVELLQLLGKEAAIGRIQQFKSKR